MSLPKKQSSGSQRQKQELVVSYQLAVAEPKEITRCLDRAFDVLFERVMEEAALISAVTQEGWFNSALRTKEKADKV